MSPWQNQARHLAVVFTIMFSMVVAPVRCRPLEVMGMGQVKGPEDLLYDPTGGGVISTGCSDGWIKRVTVNDSVADTVVHYWVNTGGRPLGLAFGSNGDILVADAYKGLVRVTREGKVEVLADEDEVEGLKFKFTDEIFVAENGTVYFTDASYKYSLPNFVLDLLEGKPHGRLISYDPSTNHTTLLASNLYLANGVAVSPDQQSVVFCETAKIGTERKVAEIVKTSGGLVSVDLEGKITTHYNDAELALIASGTKIAIFIYCGSSLYPFILRLHL